MYIQNGLWEYYKYPMEGTRVWVSAKANIKIETQDGMTETDSKIEM